MKNSFELLKDLEDEIGNVYDNELKNLLKKRNISILAHGIEPVKREDAEELYKKTLGVSYKVVDNLEELMVKSAFPKL